ncbi:unnamed protein product [Protopolystoma xenopodis]|uniref:Uncharacterized protein n=1 Tax=Protopolystoma xenopodis TaxID=117903 RepID=A0A3S5B6J6_9PLAT|nr:unnamed protein product [Protopolystoma xenopodis]
MWYEVGLDDNGTDEIDYYDKEEEDEKDEYALSLIPRLQTSGLGSSLCRAEVKQESRDELCLQASLNTTDPRANWRLGARVLGCPFVSSRQLAVGSCFPAGMHQSACRQGSPRKTEEPDRDRLHVRPGSSKTVSTKVGCEMASRLRR